MAQAERFESIKPYLESLYPSKKGGNNHKLYAKRVKKMGGREIATPEQYELIEQRLKSLYPKKKLYRKVPGEKTDFKTMRTKVIEDELRKSGITEEEIARLRGRR